MSIVGAFMVPHPPMIIPDVGRGSEARIQETIDAYEQVAGEVASLAPETIIITSPHATMYADYFHISPGRGAMGSFADFGAPGVRFTELYDEELVDHICSEASAADFPAGTIGERSKTLDHGTMVPLWFIHKKFDDFKIVRIGLSGLPFTYHYGLGTLIRKAVEKTGRRVVLAASGDLSHKLQTYGPYGFAPEGPLYDERIMDVCGRAAFGDLFDFDETFCDKAGECGHRSFLIMAGALDGTAVKAKKLSHQDVTGVGYGICAFYPEGPDEDRHFMRNYLEKKEKELNEQRSRSDIYVQLARSAVTAYVMAGKTIKLPKDLPAELLENRAGTFVSIHEHGKLRGCIGTILPAAKCVGQEIINNAIAACSRDPRFDPVHQDELKWLEINVDVLSEPEKISSPEELDVKRYGVIVTSGSRRGLLLPDLDGVDTVDEQISIAMQKGGIKKGEKYSLERFEVIRHV